MKPAVPLSGATVAALLATGLIARAEAQPNTCSQLQTTVEISSCVQAELERKDRELKQAMQTIADDAAAVPGGTFPQLWRETLTKQFHSSDNPEQQFEAFRAARQKACVFMNSLSFQGSGFGIFVTNCEIRLTDVLLEKLGN